MAATLPLRVERRGRGVQANLRSKHSNMAWELARERVMWMREDQQRGLASQPLDTRELLAADRRNQGSMLLGLQRRELPRRVGVSHQAKDTPLSANLRLLALLDHDRRNLLGQDRSSLGLSRKQFRLQIVFLRKPVPSNQHPRIVRTRLLPGEVPVVKHNTRP